ncbi:MULTISPECIES: hypothetical protein [Tsukamurella]|uniref:DUF5709 domain-containing protein n=2 Tax=Tsukamurella TaxID=2060 RepID=A0A5C5RZK6_9ACTN|nr:MULTISPECIES: hypothetical protein [Tsukamurella]NMD54641.1 hypothetical protein [Tsukamurella columbiensis]TWS28556.1 hypothetical protein FK530_13165 [Tsukamurella conjunctivitidis]
MTPEPDDHAGADGPVEDQSASVSADAEALDEDLLEHDPWATAIDPPDGWAESDRRGVTGPEQREGPSLDERLAQEEPDEDGL